MAKTTLLVSLLCCALVATTRAGSAQARSAARASADCSSASSCVESARSAASFRSSVGINTHLGYSDTLYYRDWPMIKARLTELGVSHIRDGTFAAGYPAVIGPTVAARYNQLLALGIKGNMLVGDEQSASDGAPTTLAHRLDWIKANILGFTMSVEGSNEWDTRGGDPARIQALRDAQCDLYQRVKSDPALAARPVIGPSSGDRSDDRTWYAQIGDLSACLDRGNLHPYPGQDPPHRRLSRDLSAAFDWARTTYGSQPLWATETGAWNAIAADGVSERAAATYIPRTFVEYFRRGIARTQLYELADLATGDGQAIDNYGLLRSDGTPKPAFTALRNLLAIVKDNTAASGSLGFGVACRTNCRYGDPAAYPTQDGPIRHLLLRHSSGAYFLIVWSESSVWDAATKTDTPKPAQGFDLSLQKAPAKVEIFDPAIDTSPLSTDTTGRTLVATVAPDQLRIIKVTPRGVRG